MQNVIRSRVNTSSQEFRENYEHNKRLVEEFKEILERVRNERSERAVQLQRKRGKMLARERVMALIDPESPFFELSPLAAYGMYDNEVPQAGIITGVGVVGGGKWL